MKKIDTSSANRAKIAAAARARWAKVRAMKNGTVPESDPGEESPNLQPIFNADTGIRESLAVVPATTTALATNAPAWHAEAAQLLNDNFEKIHQAFTDATKRAVWMGLFLNSVKYRGNTKTGDGSIPHGEFGPWLEKNVPNISRDTVTTYMKLATGVCETGKFQIADFPQFANCGELPPAIASIIEGKTQTQLLLEFKDTSPKKAPAEGKKLSPTELHAEQVKTIEANFTAACGALEILLTMKDVDFVLANPAVRIGLDGLCKQMRARVKQLRGKTKTHRNPKAPLVTA